MSAPPKRDRARRRAGTSPMRHLEQGGLADAVAAEDAVTSPAAASKRYVAQDVAAAVVLVEASTGACPSRLGDASAPQVDLDHARVVLHRLELPFGQHRCPRAAP